MQLRALGIILGLPFLLSGGIVTFSLIKITDYLHQASLNLEKSYECIYLAEQLEINLLLHNRNTFLYDAAGEDYYRRLSQQTSEAIAELIGRTKENSQGRTERQLINRIERQTARYLALRSQANLHSKERAVEAYLKASRSLEAVTTTIEALRRVNRSKTERLTAEVHRQKETANRLGWLAIGFFILVLLSMYFLGRTYIYRPLIALKESIGRYRLGDFHHQLKISSIDELTEIAVAYNNLTDNLQQNRKIQLRFLASIAHDLRNPLTGIRMSLDLLHPDFPASADEKIETIALIQRQTERLEHLITDLLDSVRIESGNFEIKKTTTDLRNHLQDAVNLFKASSLAHTLVFDLPAEPACCDCDPLRISQVFNNLISNAIKYSPYGGLIQIRLERQSAFFIVTISDQGIGIAASELEQIFTPFKRTNSTRELIPGVGLGLSVSRNIIEAHGGKIAVESILGKGATFRVFLPCPSPTPILPMGET